MKFRSYSAVRLVDIGDVVQDGMSVVLLNARRCRNRSDVSHVPPTEVSRTAVHVLFDAVSCGHFESTTFLNHLTNTPSGIARCHSHTEQQMSPVEVRRKSISLDCDTIYFSDVLGRFRECASGCGSSFYFEDEGDKVRKQNMSNVCTCEWTFHNKFNAVSHQIAIQHR